jgi:TetR/AcrR family transcriptional regulator of autoinduction and epiphytic fitness
MEVLPELCQMFGTCAQSFVSSATRTLNAVTMAPTSPDGRVLRARHTRAAIIDAHRALLENGELSPTTMRIAEAAGISPRTLFLHFNDLENLFAATADSVLVDVMARTQVTDPLLDLPARLNSFLTNRLDLYEFLAPFVLALRVREHNSPELRGRRRTLMEASRLELASAFAHELHALPVAEYDDAVLGLETCLSWPAWFHLHEELALGRAASERILRRNARLLLASPR